MEKGAKYFLLGMIMVFMVLVIFAVVLFVPMLRQDQAPITMFEIITSGQDTPVATDPPGFHTGSPESIYGCPGCPANFMDFAQDMCSRPGLQDYTMSDGTNTLSCSEVSRTNLVENTTVDNETSKGGRI
jgi:hypothetical protein